MALLLHFHIENIFFFFKFNNRSFQKNKIYLIESNPNKFNSLSNSKFLYSLNKTFIQ